MFSSNLNSGIPKTVEEFIEQGWLKKIKYKLMKSKLRDVLNDPEDLTQDILSDLMKKDKTTGLNYIERFSPEIRSFEVYIYVFVENFIKKKLAKENTRYGRGITNRASLESFLPSSETEIEKGVVYLDLLKCSQIPDESDMVLLDDVIKQVREELETSFKASSTSEFNGQIFNRDPLTVFNLILKDVSISEIAYIFGTSKQFIYNMRKKIATSETLKKLRNHEL